MAERSTGRESDKFMLRFPEGMRDRIKAEAERNGRSMNAEIIARLEESFIERSEIQKTADNIVSAGFNMIEMVRAFSILVENIKDNPEVRKVFLEIAHQPQPQKQDDKPK